MPISVTCPSCSVSFKTKEEYAGKRAKCPKCGEPLTIPVVDTVLMPPPAKAAAPVAARPVVASKPKPDPVPVDDEADEAPKPKRRRDPDEDEDEKPRSKKRAKDDDEDDKPRSRKAKAEAEDDEPVSPKRKRGNSDDETPKKKRRRDDDDDEPKKKSKTLPIILGIVGGLLLLCVGGCAGIYFGVIVPAAEKAKRELEAMGSDMRSRAGETQDNGQRNPAEGKKATEENMLKLKAGMTLAQVEETVGKGKVADEFDLLRGIQGDAGDAQWMAKQKANAVYSFGGNISDVLLVAFSAPPASGGTLVGVRGGFGANTFEPIKLPRGGGGTPPNTPAEGVIEVSAEAIAVEFAKDAPAAEAKYKDKTLKLTGTLTAVDKSGSGVDFKGVQPPASKKAVGVQIFANPDQCPAVKQLKVGNPATFTCKFQTFRQPPGNSPGEVTMALGVLVK